MGRKIPDLTQHVARRVRITRMFFNMSLEHASAELGVPVWELSCKENGLAPFSYREFLEIERLYKMPWRVFFQDFPAAETTGDPPDDGQQPDAVARYLALAETQEPAPESVAQDWRWSSVANCERLPGSRRWSTAPAASSPPA